jgi:myo-inositol 2-dehydrogenase/D-chiro-inositol 1-dehydrogenase
MPLDGVIVSSPTFTHEEVISEAARNGLDVFTEKPVDETADKIVNLFEVAERGGISLCCGFQRRFDASYVAAANAVRNGEIGTPIVAHIFFADHPCPPKEFLLRGGNIFMDLSAHDVDYIMQVLDDDVVSVYATGTSSCDKLAAAGVHDNANVMMKFSRGTCPIL